MDRSSWDSTQVAAWAGVLEALRAALGESAVPRVEGCAQRLLSCFSGPEPSEEVVFVGYGGGKDSSFALAFVRLLQLHVAEKLGTTFHLRVATNRHVGMPSAVMQNIDRCYRALALYDDPTVELLLVDGDDVKPFDATSVIPDALRQRNRDDVLMTGHRCHGEARPTFCNACNLAMLRSFQLGIDCHPAATVVITGDSLRETSFYRRWLRDVAGGLDVPGDHGIDDVGSLLGAAASVAASYHRDIHGGRVTTAPATRQARPPEYFTIFREVAYAAGAHWELLTGFLGFRFDEPAFSFTESDCANPMLMAHLRGLRAERSWGSGYLDGVDEYVEYATALMRRKSFPEDLVAEVRKRYDGPDAVRHMRAVATAFAEEAYGFRESELVCMVLAPFVDRGRGLDAYVTGELQLGPEAASIAHRLLAGVVDPSPGAELATVAAALERASGLRLSQLRHLYGSDAALVEGAATPVDVILRRDPHQARVAGHGDRGRDLISGR